MIQASNIIKTYFLGDVRVQALQNVSLSIEKSKIYCIMGRSGSGKSTLMRQLGLIDRPNEGSIVIDGIETTTLSEKQRTQLRLKKFGFVFQEYALVPELTALENVFLPYMQLTGGSRQKLKKRAIELLDLVGLAERVHHLPRELSGGEQQRVAFARAMVNEPEILFADEPTANLDTVASALVMYTLEKLNKEMGVTVVFVSHDPTDQRYADIITTLSDGKVVKEESKNVA